MSSKHIKPEKLADVMIDLLAEYGDEVYQIVEEEAKDAGRKATSELRQRSPGEYARKWRYRPQKDGKKKYVGVCYNLDYRLTHLLEEPHDTGLKRGGKYPRNPGGDHDHTGIIAEVEKKYSRKYYDELVKKL